MKVVFFHRKNGPTLSIEILFTTIRNYLPSSIEARVLISKFKSNGFFKRLYNIFEASFHQGDVNHVTGDVHFLTYFLRKKRTILTIHDCVSVIHSKGIKKLLLKFFWYTLPSKRVKYITVISENTKKELLSLIDFPEDRIFLIPNCISEEFKYIEKNTFNKQKPRILQIGTMFNKNLIRLCQSLKGIPCTLDIVGEISQEQLKALEENNIDYINTFNLSQEDIIKKYHSADLFVFISTYEGFGLPILEAQATGTPILVSNISPVKEVAGEGSCLVDPWDTNDIRRGILQIINDDEYRNKMIEAGLANVQNYRPEIIAKMYASVYEKVLDEVR